jgi:hypothetical protein
VAIVLPDVNEEISGVAGYGPCDQNTLSRVVQRRANTAFRRNSGMTKVCACLRHER